MYRRSAAEKPRKDSVGFFDFGMACGPFLLVGETVVSRQQTVRQYHMIR